MNETEDQIIARLKKESDEGSLIVGVDDNGHDIVANTNIIFTLPGKTINQVPFHLRHRPTFEEIAAMVAYMERTA